MDPKDFFERAHRAAEARLDAIFEYEYESEPDASELGPHPAVGLWCGCQTCLVREVLDAAWPHLRVAALTEDDGPVLTFLRHAAHGLDVRQWFDRYNCHGTFSCCVAVDTRSCANRRPSKMLTD